MAREILKTILLVSGVIYRPFDRLMSYKHLVKQVVRYDRET